MNKFLTGILVLFLLIVGVEIITLISLPKINHPAVFSSKYFSPIANSLPKGFSIINQKKNDSIGRTIVFSTTTENNAHQGIGIIYAPNTKLIRSVVGAFDNWEKISSSSDRYLLLYNPITNKPLPKFRISFSHSIKSGITPPINKITLIEILDLTKVDKTNKEAVSDYKNINEIGEEELNTLLKRGDIVTLRMVYETETTVAKDTTGVPIVGSIFLRRLGGLKNI